jgi:hypothetical protein
MKRTIGRALGVAVLLVVSVGGGALTRGQFFNATAPPKASADRLACDQLVQSFDAYPLANLGDAFEGLPLSGCMRDQAPVRYDQAGGVLQPAVDFVSFFYGTCVPPPTGEGCALPVQVSVQPPCGPSLEIEEGAVKIRGADVNLKFDGSVRIETPGYKVSIFIGRLPDKPDKTQRRDKALRAVASLRGANQLAARLSPSVALDGRTVDSGTFCK